MSSDLDLESIKQRADAATAGPWHRDHEDEYGCVSIGNYGWVTSGSAAPEYDVDSPQGHADAEFIAHARTDVPALLDLVAGLRQELDEGRAERDRLRTLTSQVDYALRLLVNLKDGPRDEAYARDKPTAWQLAREAVAAVDAYRSSTPDAEPAHRTWILPPEPGLEVTRVVDTYGQHFERQHDEHPGDDVWIGTTFGDWADVDDLVLEWGPLMAYHAPLTDATPEPAPSRPVDNEEGQRG